MDTKFHGMHSVIVSFHTYYLCLSTCSFLPLISSSFHFARIPPPFFCCLMHIIHRYMSFPNPWAPNYYLADCLKLTRFMIIDYQVGIKIHIYCARNLRSFKGIGYFHSLMPLFDWRFISIVHRELMVWCKNGI